MADLPVIAQRIATLIARREVHRRPKVPKGMRLIPHKHGELVKGSDVLRMTATLWVLWYYGLRKRLPTVASVTKALHIARGMLYQTAAMEADHQGKPLPVKTGVHVPARALNLSEPTQAQRAADDVFDPAAWWDEFGDPSLSYDDLSAMIPPQVMESLAFRVYAQMRSELEFHHQFLDVLSDLQVLQLVESSLMAQVTNFGIADGMEAAGIFGGFSLIDPQVEQFLRYQAGALIKGIDERTRQDLAETLWLSFSGIGTDPLSVDAIARFLPTMMTKLDNKLAGMSARRAAMIAQTEVARAESMGNYISMLQLGVQQVIWIVTSGACDICVTNAEQGPLDESKIVDTGIPTQYRVVPIRQPFPSGHLSPPAHPLCRCSIASAISDTWQPADWIAPDPQVVADYFSDPSWAQWPNPVTDLSAVDFGQEALNYGGLLDYKSLALNVKNALPAEVTDLQSALSTVVEQIAAAIIQAAGLSLADPVEDMLSRLNSFMATHAGDIAAEIQAQQEAQQQAGGISSGTVPGTEGPPLPPEEQYSEDYAQRLADRMRQMFEDFYDVGTDEGTE